MTPFDILLAACAVGITLAFAVGARALRDLAGVALVFVHHTLTVEADRRHWAEQHSAAVIRALNEAEERAAKREQAALKAGLGFPRDKGNVH